MTVSGVSNVQHWPQLHCLLHYVLYAWTKLYTYMGRARLVRYTCRGKGPGLWPSAELSISKVYDFLGCLLYFPQPRLWAGCLSCQPFCGIHNVLKVLSVSPAVQLVTRTEKWGIKTPTLVRSILPSATSYKSQALTVANSLLCIRQCIYVIGHQTAVLYPVMQEDATTSSYGEEKQHMYYICMLCCYEVQNVSCMLSCCLHLLYRWNSWANYCGCTCRSKSRNE